MFGKKGVDGLFDLDGDGKTTADEEFMGYKLFREFIKEDHRSEDDEDDDEDDWDDDDDDHFDELFD